MADYSRILPDRKEKIKYLRKNAHHSSPLLATPSTLDYTNLMIHARAQQMAIIITPDSGDIVPRA